MRYWKNYVKSGDPDKPDFIFRHCDPDIDQRGCLERWDGVEWVADNNLGDHVYMGEAGAKIITEKEANAFISAKGR